MPREGLRWNGRASLLASRLSHTPPFEEMPHTKSQAKRDRQAIASRARNRAIRSELKTRARQVDEAAASGDREAAEQALRIAQKRIDQAVAKGVLKKNTANRRKAGLQRRVSSL